MAIHVSTDAGMRGSQGTASYVEKLNWCTSTGTITPLHTEMREVFQHDNARPHTARATVDFLANQNVTVLPWPFKSLDLNPIEHLWMTWIDACTVVNQHRKLCKNYNRLLRKNGGEFRKTVFVDWSSLFLDGSVQCYRLMVGTTDIDFDVTSSERYGL